MQTCNPVALADSASAFYFDVLSLLADSDVPFLVGGAYALARYVGSDRETKDLDIFVRRADMGRTLELLEKAGYSTEIPFPHWLAKVRSGAFLVDIIFSSGNGIAAVDDLWFEHATDHRLLGVAVRLCPPEEMIWSKAFIQERERFDGADVLHLLNALGHRLDWDRLLARFGEHWPVFFAHIVLFRYVYPDRRDLVPQWVVDELTRRFGDLTPDASHVCRGTLLSREQYLFDLERHGYRDARRGPAGSMTDEAIRIWTKAIDERK
jgi:hypothetical protein